MNISPARTAAFDILLRIARERAFSSVLLPQYEDRLSKADRSLCHELTLGTLRRQIYLDRIIDDLARGKRLDDEVRISLRLGLYQLIYLKVPAYSAINESVELVKRAKKSSASGFVNAILRRCSREVPKLSFKDDGERLSVESSHPRWLIDKWTSDLGYEKAARLAHANNDIPRAAFRVIADLSDTELSAVVSTVPSENVEYCYVADRISSPLLDLAEKGKIYFQDEGSQMVAQCVEIPMGGAFLDVCAAPGGKTAMIFRRHNIKGVSAVAGDLYHRRVEMLRANCHRQGAGTVAVAQYDAERPLPFREAHFDTVFVDAPCTGTGTIRNNPEIRYFLSPDDPATLALKQLSILTNASKLVKPGGSLIYSTCSVEFEENESVCSTFLASQVDFEIAAIRVRKPFLTDKAFARTWPDRDGMDGFFIASFIRKDIPAGEPI